MNEFQKIKRQTKRFVKSLRVPSSCKTYCKKHYLPWSTKLTGKGTEFSYLVCQKTFCNPSCKGYPPTFKSNKIKKGFHKTLTPAQIAKLTSQGARSACVEMPDYPF